MSKDAISGQLNNKSSGSKRCVGYFRVSSEEQMDGYSIAAQERAYRQFVAANGFTSVAEYRDEGKSAHTDHIKRRPQFAQMLQDAQSGLFDTIVVHKMDRFSRSLRVAVQSFEQLGKCNVGLASISEPNLDYSSPQGRLFIHMMWVLAQFYSDNLSTETKKGKTERRQQGFYNGVLPFGVIKGEDGIPIPDRRELSEVEGQTNYDALLLIFEMAASGDSSREIAEKLNDLGFRTTGNRGNNLFTKDTLTAILRSRFYLGELPDGVYAEGHSRRGTYTKGMPGKHEAFVPVELWNAAQLVREANNNSGRYKIRKDAQVYSLSGLGECAYCGGKMHIRRTKLGTPYLYCYKRSQGIANDCTQKSTRLSVYETQIEQYLSQIQLPPDYQERIIEAYQREDSQGPGFEKQRQRLTTRLNKLKEMYEWGDVPSEQYRSKRDQLRGELATLPADTNSCKASLTRLEEYLRNVGASWRDATQEQRNQLAHTLFEKIRVENKVIKGLIPRIEFTPLLILSHINQLKKDTPQGVKFDTKKVSHTEATGFEPAVSSLTGTHVRPLHHASIFLYARSIY